MNEFINFIGICKKSGKISLGYDACLKAVKKNKSCLVLYTKDLSERSLRKFQDESEHSDIKGMVVDLKMEDFYIIFKKSVGIISINDKSLARKVEKLYVKMQGGCSL